MSANVELLEHFKRLFDFSGREDRLSFWPYAALVYGIMTVGSFAVMVPLMTSTMGTFSSSDPTSGFLPDMRLFVGGLLLMIVIGAGLYAAAVVRRLHDGGLSGLWALMPVPFLLFSLFKMYAFFHSFGSGNVDLNEFNLIFASNLIYMLTLIALIVLCSRRSDPGPNRFDESE